MRPRGKGEPAYGAPVSVRHVRKHEIATMPWPHPCSICRRATRIEIDGQRLCRLCTSKGIPG